MKGLNEINTLNAIDRRFADLIVRLSESEAPELWLAAALASKAVQDGHVCLDLKAKAGKVISGEDEGFVCPDWNVVEPALAGAKTVGTPGEYKPLILDEAGRLYLYRYWQYEKIVAEFFKGSGFLFTDKVNASLLRQGLERLFPKSGDTLDDQKIAALTAVCRRFTIITGGPGTGKTSTVVKILALLLEQNRNMRIALAAPTGKAAARLADSVKKARESLCCADEIKALIPETASTLHRLLGFIPHATNYRYNEKNLLPLDALAVDEASMIDLPLMAKLVLALPVGCRLILLGDRDQLASVQPGAVFGDLCDSGDTACSGEYSSIVKEIAGESVISKTKKFASPGLRDSIVTLQKSYRFGTDSGIGEVSRKVNRGDGSGAADIAASGIDQDVLWRDLPAGSIERALERIVLDEYGPYLESENPEEAFAAFNRFRILCAVRQGPLGVTALNEAVMKILGRAGLIHPEERWFRGQPILVTRNDYGVKLFNGDIGIVYPDREDAEGGFPKRVFFPAEEGGFRKILPMRLPECETVYAMTVHKSQGSEFEHVLLIVPPIKTDLLTRELIYTGITRARKKVEIWGSRPEFIEAVESKIERTSGLRDSLWR